MLQRTTQQGFPDVGALIVAAAQSCRGLLGHTEYMHSGNIFTPWIMFSDNLYLSRRCLAVTPVHKIHYKQRFI